MSGLHRVLALAAGAAALGALAAGEPTGRALDVTALAREIAAARDHVSAPELGAWIVAGEPVRVFDLRDATAHETLRVPTSERIDLAALAKLDLPRDTRIVLYSEGGAHAAQAWVLLRARGYTDVRFLREGLYEWVARVLEPRLAVDASPAESAAYVQAAPLARHFGGQPRRGVARAEVPTGYWTEPARRTTTARTDVVGSVRRRGC